MTTDQVCISLSRGLVFMLAYLVVNKVRSALVILLGVALVQTG